MLDNLFYKHSPALETSSSAPRLDDVTAVFSDKVDDLQLLAKTRFEGVVRACLLPNFILHYHSLVEWVDYIAIGKRCTMFPKHLFILIKNSSHQYKIQQKIGKEKS